MQESDLWEEEDIIALRALATLLEVDGYDELAQAQREALAVVAQEAVALKQRRQERERQSANQRRIERERRQAEVLAKREAERIEADRRARQARERAERQEAEQAERARRAREAQQAARIESERQERARQEEARLARVKREERRREEAKRASLQCSRAEHAHQRNVLPPPASRPVRVSCADIETTATPERSPVSAPTHRSSEGSLPLRSADMQSDLSGAPLPPLTGADLTSWRSHLGLTQQVAAERLGVRQGTISKAEHQPNALLGPALRRALADAKRAG